MRSNEDVAYGSKLLAMPTLLSDLRGGEDLLLRPCSRIRGRNFSSLIAENTSRLFTSISRIPHQRSVVGSSVLSSRGLHGNHPLIGTRALAHPGYDRSTSSSGVHVTGNNNLRRIKGFTKPMPLLDEVEPTVYYESTETTFISQNITPVKSSNKSSHSEGDSEPVWSGQTLLDV